MAKHTKLGKVILNHLGYSVRQMINTSTNAKKETTVIPTGKFGIYAGKRLIIRDIDNPKDAVPFIEEEIKSNKNKREREEQAHQKKMQEINSKTKRTW